MGNVEEKVIKPPIESIRSGSIFRPAKAYVRKILLKSGITALLIYFAMITMTRLIAYGLEYAEPETYVAEEIIKTWLGKVVVLGFIGNLLWLIPLLVLIPIFVKTIEYSVRAKSGEAMPEIYVKEGLFTITVNHVPFRTITNISSKAGVFDRLFGIGSVHIETAGNSNDIKGPEETLEGIVFYEEVRDYILAELRKFRDPYVTGTEVCFPSDAFIPECAKVNKVLMETMKDIKKLLEEKD